MRIFQSPMNRAIFLFVQYIFYIMIFYFFHYSWFTVFYKFSTVQCGDLGKHTCLDSLYIYIYISLSNIDSSLLSSKLYVSLASCYLLIESIKPSVSRIPGRISMWTENLIHFSFSKQHLSVSHYMKN